jgi:hypothetical protein
LELRSRPDAVLGLEQVHAQRVEISEDFNALLARPAIAARPNAKQWKFVRHCFEALMNDKGSDFPGDKAKITQYRFEVEDRLSRFYARSGPPVRYMFSLRHAVRSIREGVVDERYPQCNGYILLVSDVRADHERTPLGETRSLLERTVADAIDAEFTVYRALPKIDLSPLDRVYIKDGPAYKRIHHLAEQHHRKRWTIANHNNPSTRRLIAIKKIEVRGDEAVVRTEEYWYLRWWSLSKKKNVEVYNTVNFQTYFLVKKGDSWFVDHNIYPPRRASAARRKWYER